MVNVAAIFSAIARNIAPSGSITKISTPGQELAKPPPSAG